MLRRYTRWIVLMIVCALAISPFASLSAPAAARVAAQDPVGTFEETACPFALPSGVVAGRDVICGYVTVPERHANPGGPVIKLAVAVIKSTGENPAPDPLVIEAGGPGFPSMLSGPGLFTLTDLLAGRDLVIVEQRGIGDNDPALTCDEGANLIREHYGDFVDDTTALELEQKALKACYTRWQSDGVDLSAYNSLENAADFPVALTALGYDQFNFYGVSYASALGQHLMRDYPDRLRSVILDAVVPLPQNFMVYAPQTISRAFHRLFERCAADPGCNAAYPDLESVFFALVDAYNAAPVATPFRNITGSGTVEAPASGVQVILALYEALYWSRSIEQLPAQIYALADGDPALITNNTTASTFGFRASNGMNLSVICSEFAQFADDDFPQVDVYPQVADAMRYSVDYRPLCETAWPVDLLPEWAHDAIISDIPTLVLSGEFDPITPPENGDLLAETLSRAYVYTFPNTGHGSLGSSACSLSIAQQFIDDPARAPDSACLDGLAAAGFASSLDPDAITLEPVTLDTYGLSTVRPSGWTEIEPGVYAAPAALALFLAYSVPDWQAVTAAYQRFDPAYDHLTVNGQEWALHEAAMSLSGASGIIAVTPYEDGYFVIGVVGSSTTLPALYDSVLLPALEAFAVAE